jgi:hypothetical protein
MIIDFLSSLHNFDMNCLILLVGVLVSTIILRVSGTSPGGILAAAFFVLSAVESLYWAVTLLVLAPFISWFYARFLSHIYAGREPAFIMAGISALLATTVGLGFQHWQLLPDNSLSFPLGIVLPAIIATAIRKQGVLSTYRYLIVAVVLTVELIIIIHSVGSWLGYDFRDLQYLAEARPSLDTNWGSVFAIISVTVGFLLYRRYQIKSAGFVMLPLLAAIAIISPLNFLLLLATAGVVYFLTKQLQRHSLVVGITRYAVVCAISVTLVWTITDVLLHVTTGFSPYMGAGLFAVLAVCVVANEHVMYGLGKTLPLFAAGLVIMATIEVGGSMVVQAIWHTHPVQPFIIRHTTEPTKE